MKKVLYVDFHGTLSNDVYWRSSGYSADITAMLFGSDTKMIHAWMRGEYTAEQVNEFVANQLGLPYQTVWDGFVHDCKTIQVDPKTLELIQQLRNEYWTVCITGNMDSFDRFTVPALRLTNVFDHISNSYNEQMHKTDHGGRLFKAWSHRLGVPLIASFLIDDHDDCCQVFSSLGGKACQTESLAHTQKILESLM